MTLTTYKRFPLNAAGDFYVLDDYCLCCRLPHAEAPELMAPTREEEERAIGNPHCYFRRQPETPEEVERAICAVAVSCAGALRYAGSNPDILRRLIGAQCKVDCDFLEGWTDADVEAMLGVTVPFSTEKV